VPPVRVLIVLPTFDEAGNIAEVLRRIRAAAPAVDVLVVDDSSPDGTADQARVMAAELGQIDVVVRPRKDGLGNAYRQGFGLGFERGYDVLVQMDADLSHDPADLPRLLAPLANGADAVVGSRYVEGGSSPNWPWYRRALSRHGNRGAARLLDIGVHDTTSGFRSYRTSTLQDIDVLATRANGYGFQIETAYRIDRAGHRVEEIPIEFTDRVRGHSKLSLGVVVEEAGLVVWWGLRDRLVRRLRRRPREPRAAGAPTPE
jgi:glycosyltransferase involved in cell wall biosynthesis